MLAELVGGATRKAFSKVVSLCLDEQVDGLLLSGDLYDGDQTSMKTARFLADQIGELHGAGIKVYVIRGNHDALSRITKELTFPDSVTLFGGRAGTVEVARERGALPVVIHGISFAQSHAPDSLLAKFKQPVEGAFNIGLLHTSLGGSPGHDRYAPCDLADLQGSGFRYWALGHIHKRSVADGSVTVVMPGIPQGRDIGEAGTGSVTLVTVGDDGTVILEERHTSIAQFERVTVDLTGTLDWREMVAAVGVTLGRAKDRLVSEHLVARVSFVGATALTWRMRRDLDLLRTEAENQAALVGRTYIDKVEVNCEAPEAAPGAATGADPLEELHRLMGDIAGSDAFRAELAVIAEELRTQMPSECRASLGDSPEAFAATLLGSARDGIDDVLARLRGSEGEEH